MSLLESATPAPASSTPAAPTPDAASTATPEPAPAPNVTPPAADGNAPKPDPKALPSPEGYAAFKLPDGVELPADTLAKFTEVAKELKLPQDKAQALIDIATANNLAAKEAAEKGWNDVCEGWVKEITDDKEFGGAKLKETCTLAKQAIDKFGSPELLDFLDQTGYGNNPHLIRFLAKVSKATGEDKLIDGKPPANNTRTAAEVIYGNNYGK